jgi:catechol 2,3-dioxygenase-like lactoylglutathione lyase family enzyme
MSSGVLHHIGLQVSDIERAARFWCDAFGARLLTRPVTFAGPGADQAMGVPGTRMKLAFVALGDVAIELFELLGPAVPDWAQLPRTARLPHVCVHVEDTDAALERVEAAGGRRVWDAVDRFGPARAVYAADPDGNVIELLDRPPADIAATVLRWFPEADPSRPAAEA